MEDKEITESEQAAWQAGVDAGRMMEREGGELIHMIAEKFSSGNEIQVDRITITRNEYLAVVAQQ